MTYQGHNGTGQGYSTYNQPQVSYSQYGNVSYANHGAEVGTHATLESIKHGVDAINRLLPDSQNGRFDPSILNQVVDRVTALQNSVPLLATPAVNGTVAGEGGVYGPTAMHYSLPPMDNLRTKDQIESTSVIIDQMSATLYEHQGHHAGAGTGWPGARALQEDMHHRGSNSPPGLQLPSSHNILATTPQSNHDGTPSLTPPSSAVSNTSGNSPPYTHSNHGMSPSSPTGQMYPPLPLPGPGTSSTSHGYLPSMAPASTLSNQFNDQHRRRYSGGRLQKAAPGANQMDTTVDEASSPRHSFSNSDLDPALMDGAADIITFPSENSGEMDEKPVKVNGFWLSNIRIVEALQKWLDWRIEHRMYESGGEEESLQHHEYERREVQESSQHHEYESGGEEESSQHHENENGGDGESSKGKEKGAVLYPPLPI